MRLKLVLAVLAIGLGHQALAAGKSPDCSWSKGMRADPNLVCPGDDSASGSHLPTPKAEGLPGNQAAGPPMLAAKTRDLGEMRADGSRITLTTLYPPIAAATIINVFLFALMWRGSQIEKRTGKPPWPMILGLLAYGGSLACFFYVRNSHPLQDWPDLFGAALIGEAMGVVVTFGILNAFIFSRGQKKAERAAAFAGAVFLTGLMFAGLFIKS
jgi:hypothetical protein